MVLSSERLLKILNYLNLKFPHLNRISTYAIPKDLKNKTLDELTVLHKAGLKLIYVGIETGDDELLDPETRKIIRFEELLKNRIFLADRFEIKNERAKALIIRHCIDNIGDLIRFEMVHGMLKNMGIKEGKDVDEMMKDGKNVDEMMRATKIDENTKKAMRYYFSHYFGILEDPKFEESKSLLNRGGQAPTETNKLSSNAQGGKQNSTSSDTSSNRHAGPQNSPKEDSPSNRHAGPGTSPRPKSSSEVAPLGRASSNGSSGSEFSA
jgi:hypothetical protein